jgi:hypothetical protein
MTYQKAFQREGQGIHDCYLSIVVNLLAEQQQHQIEEPGVLLLPGILMQTFLSVSGEWAVFTQSIVSLVSQPKVQKQTFHHENHSKNKRFKKKLVYTSFYAAFYAGQNQCYIVSD